MPPPISFQIETARLLLRATRAEDASRAFEIQSKWQVAKMLRMASYPPAQEEIEEWFAGHREEWLAGTAYRFAVTLDKRMIGIIDIDEIDESQGDLGYWLDEPYWGQGFAKEAGIPMLAFAFQELNLKRLQSGHASDNPASGKVLKSLGFRHVEDLIIPSRSRGSDIVQQRYVLENNASRSCH